MTKCSPTCRILPLLWLIVLLLSACQRQPERILDTTAPISAESEPMNGFSAPSGTHTVTFAFVNAGKADCIVLLADEQLYCIDTGLDTSVANIAFCIGSLGKNSIDGVFFTHGDRDHIGGYSALSALFPVAQTYAPWYAEDPTVFTALDDAVTFLQAGTSVPIGGEGLYLDVLAPLSRNADDNNNSLILRLTSGETTILFTGDMCEVERDALLAAYPDMLHATVWKAPYHGRDGSVTKELLDAVSPQYSFVCANRDTNPDSAAPECMELLSAGSAVYCTEDATLGWKVTVSPNGTIAVEDLCPAVESDISLSIAEINPKKQRLTIVNTGEYADLSGCIVEIAPSGSLYRIPDGTILEKGTSVTIGAHPAELIWQAEDKLLRKKKSDTITIYDPTGYPLVTAVSNS